MKRHRIVVVPFILVLAIVSQLACGAGTLSKLHSSLNKAAKLENAAAKTNRQFYEGGVYGPVGSLEAIEWRQKGAKAVHDSNELLIKALTLAKALTPETFEGGKLEVLRVLSDAVRLLRTGNNKIDLVLQSVATVINQAIVIIQAFQAKDLPRVLPAIRNWQLARVEV